MKRIKFISIAAIVAAVATAHADVTVQLYNPPSSDQNYEGQGSGAFPFGDPLGSAFTSPNVGFGTYNGWNWWPVTNEWGNAAFAAEITGTLTVQNSGQYYLGTTSDDGSFLYVDGQTVDNSGQHGPSTQSSLFDLTAGTPYVFTIDFFTNDYGTSGVDFVYATPNTGYQLVPAGDLNGSTSSTPGPTALLPFAAGLLMRRRRRS